MTTTTETQTTTVIPERPPLLPVSLASPPEPPATSSGVLRAALGCVLVAGWFVFFVLAISGMQATRSQYVLYGELRAQLAQGTAPIGGAIAPGTPVALIEAPAIGMRYVVVEGTASGDLRAGPGHRRDTPLPGQPGASVLYGRASAFGGPFRNIGRLFPGADIVVTTGQGTFEYKVSGVRREGDPMPGPAPTGSGRLTLVSAEGVGWRAGWAADRIVYVDANLLNAPAQAPAGRPTVVPEPEVALQGDPSAWITLVLWLQVLAVAAFAASWAVDRWGMPRVWLAFSPIILAGLWGASESVVQLLPNLM